MYAIFGNSNVELCKKVGKVDAPKFSSWKKIFMFITLLIIIYLSFLNCD